MLWLPGICWQNKSLKEQTLHHFLCAEKVGSTKHSLNCRLRRLTLPEYTRIKLFQMLVCFITLYRSSCLHAFLFPIRVLLAEYDVFQHLLDIQVSINKNPLSKQIRSFQCLFSIFFWKFSPSSTNFRLTNYSVTDK